MAGGAVRARARQRPSVPGPWGRGPGGRPGPWGRGRGHGAGGEARAVPSVYPGVGWSGPGAGGRGGGLGPKISQSNCIGEEIPDYVDEVDMVQATTVGTGCDVDAAVEHAIDSRAFRELSFFQRGTKRTINDHEVSFQKAPKRYRKSAFLFGCALQAQLEEDCGIPGGFAFYSQDPDPSKRLPWHLRPNLALCTDEGSPECAFGYWAVRHKELSLDILHDRAHGVHNDFFCTSAQCGLSRHVKMRMLAWNVAHSPWGECTRQQELSGNHEASCRFHHLPTDSPAFQELLPRMLRESGDEHLAVMADVEQRVWESVVAENPYERREAKVASNRFLAYLHRGKHDAPLQTRKAYRLLSTVLEQNYLGRGRLSQLLCNNTKDEGGEQGSTKRLNSGDAAVISAAVNLLVVATLVMLDEQDQIRERVLVRMAEDLLPWYEKMSKCCRSVQGSMDWLLLQLEGEFLAGLGAILKKVSTPMDLEWMFVDPPNNKRLARMSEEERQMYLGEQDEAVQLASWVGLSLVCNRISREASMMFGLSTRSLLLLSTNDRMRSEELSHMELLYELDIEARDHSDQPGVKALHSISQFRQPVVGQIMEGLHEVGFQNVSDTMHEFLQKKHRRITQSEVVEVSFLKQKRMVDANLNKSCSLRKAWHRPIDAGVLDNAFHFDPVRLDTLVPLRGETIEDRSFTFDLKPHNFDLSGLSTGKQSADWWSPDKKRRAAEFFAPQFTRYLSDRDKWHLAKQTQGNCFANVQHNIIVRETSTPGKMFMVGLQVPGSMCVAWPMVRKRVGVDAAHGGGTLSIFQFKPTAVVAEILVCFADMDEWEAIAVRRASPSSLAWRGVSAHDAGGGGFVASEDVGEWDSLWKVAARHSPHARKSCKLRGFINSSVLLWLIEIKTTLV